MNVSMPGQGRTYSPQCKLLPFERFSAMYSKLLLWILSLFRELISVHCILFHVLYRLINKTELEILLTDLFSCPFLLVIKQCTLFCSISLLVRRMETKIMSLTFFFDSSVYKTTRFCVGLHLFSNNIQKNISDSLVYLRGFIKFLCRRSVGFLSRAFLVFPALNEPSVPNCVPFFLLLTFWRHLWSITEQTHGNMESSIC